MEKIVSSEEEIKTQDLLDSINVKETTEDRLKRLGFTHAGTTIEKAKDIKDRLGIAYKHFRHVPQEKINEFNARLKEKTIQSNGYRKTWKELSFTPIDKYDKVPPESALMAIESAQKRKCFDSFEVAEIRNVEDPIIFGRIKGCPDRFFIAQWDVDVTIDDLLRKDGK